MFKTREPEHSRMEMPRVLREMMMILPQIIIKTIRESCGEGGFEQTAAGHYVRVVCGRRARLRGERRPLALAALLDTTLSPRAGTVGSQLSGSQGSQHRHESSRAVACCFHCRPLSSTIFSEKARLAPSARRSRNGKNPRQSTAIHPVPQFPPRKCVHCVPSVFSSSSHTPGLRTGARTTAGEGAGIGTLHAQRKPVWRLERRDPAPMLTTPCPPAPATTYSTFTLICAARPITARPARLRR